MCCATFPGMCGVVDGGISEGSWGYEAGQSGVGDIFGWFVDNCVPERYHVEARRRGVSLHEHLTELRGRQRVGEHGLVALDWHSGNRSVLVDHELSGVMIGQTLAHDLCRHVPGAVGGHRVRHPDDRRDVRRQRVPVTELVVAGGLLKNQLLMQIYADAVGLPLSTVTSAQAPALGSAIHAAVGRRRVPRCQRRRRRRWAGGPATPTRRSPRTSPPTTSSTASTSRPTTGSVAATTMMRRLRRIGTTRTGGAFVDDHHFG